MKKKVKGSNVASEHGRATFVRKSQLAITAYRTKHPLYRKTGSDVRPEAFSTTEYNEVLSGYQPGQVVER
jgi:hypothetical protein